MSLFRFKQFDISHSHSSMKVGTDALLLGAWADVSNAQNILDVGTGCGVIALMLAQRNEKATISAIDIDAASVTEAKMNAANSKWNERIRIEHVGLQQLKSNSHFDLIVSNPPFFANGTTSPKAQRQNARHNQELNNHDLIHYAAQLLNPEGKLCLILPKTEAEEFKSEALNAHYHLNRVMAFRSKEHLPVERLLLELSMEKKVLMEEELVHYKSDGNWTDDYQRLTQEFHFRP